MMTDKELLRAIVLGMITGFLSVMFCCMCYVFYSGIKHFAEEQQEEHYERQQLQPWLV